MPKLGVRAKWHDINQLFHSWDTDGMGTLSFEELEEILASGPSASDDASGDASGAASGDAARSAQLPTLLNGTSTAVPAIQPTATPGAAPPPELVAPIKKRVAEARGAALQGNALKLAPLAPWPLERQNSALKSNASKERPERLSERLSGRLSGRWSGRLSSLPRRLRADSPTLSSRNGERCAPHHYTPEHLTRMKQQYIRPLQPWGLPLTEPHMQSHGVLQRPQPPVERHDKVVAVTDAGTAAFDSVKEIGSMHINEAPIRQPASLLHPSSSALKPAVNPAVNPAMNPAGLRNHLWETRWGPLRGYTD